MDAGFVALAEDARLVADHLVLERRRQRLLVDEGVCADVAHCVFGQAVGAVRVALRVRTAEELRGNLAEVGDLGLDGFPLSGWSEYVLEFVLTEDGARVVFVG